jgi:hypothetical protein
VTAAGLPAQAAPAGPGPDFAPGPGEPAGGLVRVSVLGPLRITAAGREAGGGLRKARELIAFLAVHSDGASGEAVGEALWPGARRGEAVAGRNLAVAKARVLLRAASGAPGRLWITRAAGRYRLDPALVATDLRDFDLALEEARRTGGPAGGPAAGGGPVPGRARRRRVRVGGPVRGGRPPPRAGRAHGDRDAAH